MTDILGLIADIGGTNARFALVDDQGRIAAEETLATTDFAGPLEAALAYLATQGGKAPARVALAVACPVKGDRVSFTNNDWAFSVQALGDGLGVEALSVINDFAAQALALPKLATKDLLPVGGVKVDPTKPKVVLGPGTGLGVAGLVPSPLGPIPVVTEGGHVTLAASDDAEAEILKVLRDEFGHVSAERVLSGPGLSNLYRAIATLKGETVADLAPADVLARGRYATCPICLEALMRFQRWLGSVAGDLALSYGAQGGVYIAGGILPRLEGAVAEGPFRDAFEAKGRFKAYLADIPVFVVTHPNPAFLGLAALVVGK